MPAGEAKAIIKVIREEVGQSVEAVMTNAEQALRGITAIRGGDSDALEHVEAALCAILEACAFEDIAGQRLSQLEAMVRAAVQPRIGGDPLLNGPALPGQGIDQAAADAHFPGAAK